MTERFTVQSKGVGIGILDGERGDFYGTGREVSELLNALDGRLADARECAEAADVRTAVAMDEAARWAARVKALEARLEAVVAAVRGTG